MLELSELAGIGAQALPDGAPDPEEVRDDSDEYMALEAEIAKLISPHASDPISWREVVEKATIILRDKSKDIQAAAYLCRGLWEEAGGYPGLHTGLRILHDVLVDHWDTAYPPFSKKRAKRRAGEVEWLAARVAPVLTEETLENADAEAINRCAELVKEIERYLGDKLEDKAPGLRPLREPLDTYQKHFALEAQQKKQAEEEKRKQEEAEAARREKEAKKARQAAAAKQAEAAPPSEPAATPPSPPAEAAQAAPAPVQSAPPPPVAAAPPVSVGSSANEQEIKKAFKSCGMTLSGIVVAKRSADLANPAAYRLARTLAWMSIDKLPGHQNGKCFFPPPPANLPKQCEQWLAQNQYADLIEAVEKFIANPDAPANGYWLDAQRFTATALEALGPQYAGARKAVVTAFAEFLGRLPGVQDLQFSDGKDLADPQTKAWIQDEVLAAATSEAGTAGGGDEGGIRKQCAESAKEARKVAAKGGGFGEALQVFREAKKHAADQREQFIWHLEQARFCYDSGHPELALPQLEFLDTQAAEFRLEVWEPALSAELAQLLLLCHNKLGKDKESAAYQQWYARLCRLDPAVVPVLS